MSLTETGSSQLMLISSLPTSFLSYHLGTICSIHHCLTSHQQESQVHSLGNSCGQNLYLIRGFRLLRLNVDNEFINWTDDYLQHGINFNVDAANEHVPSIERRIRVIKERARYIRHILLYKSMPKPLVITLI